MPEMSEISKVKIPNPTHHPVSLETVFFLLFPNYSSVFRTLPVSTQFVEAAQASLTDAAHLVCLHY